MRKIESKVRKFKLVGHSHQIADTGDYDGHWEITNGAVSFSTKDDDDESLQEVIKALNDSGCEFYPDDKLANDNAFLECENSFLKQIIRDHGIQY